MADDECAILGAVKTSWPDIAYLIDEEGLNIAHQPVHLSIVAHTRSSNNVSSLIGMPMGVCFVQKKQNTVWIGSHGLPLNKCPDALHLLKTFFDGILAHWRLLQRGTLHRDISWGNVLYQPVDNRDIDNQSCIEELGDPEGRSYTLLANLDHAINIDEVASLSDPDLYEKTGAPMFISLELSSSTDLALAVQDYGKLVNLHSQIKGAQERCGEIFRRLFPHEDENASFMSVFERAIEDAKVRALTDIEKREAIWTDRNETHRPHHDVESFYWVFLWAFARALPKNSTDEIKAKHNSFCQTMLEHVPGKEETRTDYLYELSETSILSILHSQLNRFRSLFLRMACYLSLPWRKYNNLQPDHAHKAFLLLLLPQIQDLQDHEDQNIELEPSIRPFLARRAIQPPALGLMPGSSLSTSLKRKSDIEEGTSTWMRHKGRNHAPTNNQPYPPHTGADASSKTTERPKFEGVPVEHLSARMITNTTENYSTSYCS